MAESTMDHTDLIEEDGLLFAYTLDGKGGAKFLGWQDIDGWTEADGPLWVHLDNKHPNVATWLKARSGLTNPTAEALLAEETRPHVFRGKRGLVAILRGVNLNNAAPVDLPL